MENQINENDNYEHNDGLGDLLKEREKLEFSWAKTSVVVGVLLAIIVLTGFFIFKFGKDIVSKSSSNSTTAQVEKAYINDRTTSNKNKQSQEVEDSKSTKITSQKQSILKASSQQKTTTQKKPYYKVITGTFKSKTYAQNLIKKLKNSGFDGFYKTISSASGARLYRVQSGSFLKKHQAEKFKIKLSISKFQSYIITE